MSNLSIQTDLMQKVPLIRVQGRVDSETAPQLDQALSEILEGKNRLVVNLKEVDFISSAGLRAIVKAYQAAKKAGGNVHLSEISEPIEVVLRTVGMMQLLRLFASDQEAMNGF